MIAQDTLVDVELVSIEWSEQFGAWLVVWVGHVHGGCHYRREDADVHAGALLEDPDWEDWLAMHQYGQEEAR